MMWKIENYVNQLWPRSFCISVMLFLVLAIVVIIYTDIKIKAIFIHCLIQCDKDYSEFRLFDHVISANIFLNTKMYALDKLKDIKLMGTHIWEECKIWD